KPAGMTANLLDPPFIYPSKLATPPTDDEAKAPAEDRIDQATVIMLESPLISMLPPLDRWNHGLLYADLADDTESAFAREIPEGQVVMKDGRPVVELT